MWLWQHPDRELQEKYRRLLQKSRESCMSEVWGQGVPETPTQVWTAPTWCASCGMPIDNQMKKGLARRLPDDNQTFRQLSLLEPQAYVCDACGALWDAVIKQPGMVEAQAKLIAQIRERSQR